MRGRSFNLAFRVVVSVVFALSYLDSLYCLMSFFFNDPPTTEIYTLSLHDALPICVRPDPLCGSGIWGGGHPGERRRARRPILDRKSTRLNSSHVRISYAVFCLKKKTFAPYSTNTYEHPSRTQLFTRTRPNRPVPAV